MSEEAKNLGTVAVIGAGQLARMLQSEAIELGIKLRLLASSRQDPGFQVCPDTLLGSPDNLGDLKEVTKTAQVLTCEHELIDLDLCKQLSAQNGIEIHPRPQALLYAQNKIAMRSRLQNLGIACPKFFVPSTNQASRLKEICDFAAQVQWPIIGKVSHGGYDGRGVEKIANENQAQDWLESLESRREILFEQCIDFRRELAIMAARTPSGDFASWPVVQSLQVDGQCAQVISPAPKLCPQTAARAEDIARTLGQELGITGCFAVELFETKNGEILVNELAMRPHNSGHWTQDGSRTSQFEQHLRAVLDLPLGSTQSTAKFTAMANILGSNLADPSQAVRQVLAHYPGVKIHLYGKENRPKRKLGHVNFCDNDPEKALAVANEAAQILMGNA